MKRTQFVAAMMLSFGLAIAGAAYAGPATDVVKSKQTSLYDLVKQSAPQAKVTALIDEMVDYQAIAEASLGSEWGNRTDAEKAQYSDLLKQLVRRSYERNIKKTVNYNIDYLTEESSGGAFVVKTKATSKTNAREEPVTIDYKMVEKDGKWRIVDIKTDDVSLVSSYRSQFTKIIKKDGFPVLIQKMKDKIAKGDV